MIYDTLILGGGPAGYTAALYCARAGLRVLLAEKLGAGGQMATTSQIENYPGFAETVDGFTLAQQMQQAAEAAGAVTKLAEVTALDLASCPKHITTSEEEILAHTVILASGAVPRTLGLAEEDALRGRGVSYCATCDGMFYRGKTVVVVGGGNSAAEEALFLSKLCKKVYLVHRRDTLRAGQAETAHLMQAENVEFIWDSVLTEIAAETTVTGVTLQNVRTQQTSSLACDGVFVAIGRVPSSQLFAGQIDLDAQGYIVADETTCTSVPGVFVAGDVRTKPLRQIVTAAADGATASLFVEKYLTQHVSYPE